MEKSCSVLIHFDKGTPAHANDIKEALEGNDDTAKADAMKKVIMLLLNGESLPQLFITIVQYVLLPSEDHKVQKLLFLYLENFRKTDFKKKIKPDLSLICQNLNNNLFNGNDYIRGVTLRFLSCLCETEIIKPLIGEIKVSLLSMNPVVRRSALLVAEAIYKLPNRGDIKDLNNIPELIGEMLSTECGYTVVEVVVAGCEGEVMVVIGFLKEREEE